MGFRVAELHQVTLSRLQSRSVSNTIYEFFAMQFVSFKESKTFFNACEAIWQKFDMQGLEGLRVAGRSSKIGRNLTVEPRCNYLTQFNQNYSSRKDNVTVDSQASLAPKTAPALVL